MDQRSQTHFWDLWLRAGGCRESGCPGSRGRRWFRRWRREGFSSSGIQLWTWCSEEGKSVSPESKDQSQEVLIKLTCKRAARMNRFEETATSLSMLPRREARNKAIFSMATPKKVMKRMLLSTSWLPCAEEWRLENTVFARVTTRPTMRGMIRQRSVTFIERIGSLGFFEFITQITIATITGTQPLRVKLRNWRNNLLINNYQKEGQCQCQNFATADWRRGENLGIKFFSGFVKWTPFQASFVLRGWAERKLKGRRFLDLILLDDHDDGDGGEGGHVDDVEGKVFSFFILSYSKTLKTIKGAFLKQFMFHSLQAILIVIRFPLRSECWGSLFGLDSLLSSSSWSSSGLPSLSLPTKYIVH